MPVLLTFCCSYSLECHLFANSPLVEALRLIQDELARYSPYPDNPYATNTSFDPMPRRTNKMRPRSR